MADDKQYLEVGFRFEDEGQITPRVQKTLERVSDRVKLNLDLGLDSVEMDSLINKLGKIDKKSFTLFDNGTEQTISDINIGLAQTIKLQEKINKKGEVNQKYTITDNTAKATKDLYTELIKLQETEFKIKNQMLSADGEQLRILQQQLVLTNSLQNNLGKSINKNSLTDSEYNNKLVKERLNLNNELMKSQAQVTLGVEKQIQRTIEEEKATARLIEVKKKNFNTKIDALQGKYSSNKSTVEELEELRVAINKVNGSNLKDVRYEFQLFENDVKSVTNKAQSQLSNITKTDNKSMMDNLKANISSLTTYALGGSFVYSSINAFREAITYTIEMNTALTNLKKVTDETDITYTKFVGTMHTMSMELGTQSNLLTEAVTSWSKTGKSLEDSTNLANNTMILKNVGDISSVAEAQKMMIAPLKAFNIEAKDSIKLLDQYNNVSNNMAATTDDLGQALSRSASSMAVAGNSLQQTIAMIATAQANTQLGGDVIGQA